MCVGRYAAKVMRNERSEMEHNRSEMPAKVTKQICIPVGCDYAIKVQLMLSHSAGMQHPDISIAGISKRFHFASLHYIFSAYLPTHIKFLTEFHRIVFGTTCISFPKKNWTNVWPKKSEHGQHIFSRIIHWGFVCGDYIMHHMVTRKATVNINACR